MTTAQAFEAFALVGTARKAYWRLDDGRPALRPGSNANGMTAVVFSALALEGFINELAEHAASHPMSIQDERVRSYGTVMGQLGEETSINLKYQLTAIIFGGRSFDRGREPFQGFSLLIRLRNAIVHLKPTRQTLSEGGRRSNRTELLAALRSRHLIAELPPNIVVSLLQHVGSRAIARWAVNTSCAMAQATIDLLPDGEFKESVRGMYGHAFRPITGASSNDGEFVPGPTGPLGEPWHLTERELDFMNERWTIDPVAPAGETARRDVLRLMALIRQSRERIMALEAQSRGGDTAPEPDDSAGDVPV